MINIKENRDCCGCEACVQICQKKHIAFDEDEEGFLYPKVNVSLCTDCGLCEKVCPVINQREKREPLYVYAAKNKDEQIRAESSSGGIFTLLAEKVIREDGVVFGARFDENWNVIHDYTEELKGLAAFRGSKYVQSRIGRAYHEAKCFLNEGREVLFSGTPCQIAGLKFFLQKEYDNLLTLDIICHGVPSPKVWRMYRKEILNKLDKKKTDRSYFSKILFRDKSRGWADFHLSLTIENEKSTRMIQESFRENMYMKGFLQDLYLRPSCYACSAKQLKSGSDITLGDFWGIKKILPEFDDDKGISLVFCNTRKGVDFYSKLNLISRICDYDSAVVYNSAVERSVPENGNRAAFFSRLDSKGVNVLIDKLTKRSFVQKVKAKLYNKLKTD